MRLNIEVTNDLYPWWWINLMRLDSFDEVLETIRSHGGVYHDGFDKEVSARWIEFADEKDAAMFLLRWS
jgi:hypothetical protein